ncbi:MAG: molybdate ABC transporter substrate-binding protein [Mariprofundaceae bacterium]|nr:molybdate ABC transporter substrate-binding protein [Mariprofundaceae bacterium]
MSKYFKACVFFISSLLYTPLTQATENLTIVVASSLYLDMQQQAKSFEEKHNVRIRLISGSTGRLYNQIMQGAPFDVFIAADNVRPALLLKQGRALSQHIVGQGYLGLMVGKHWVSNPALLNKPDIQHIAIANPDVAPFGMAAKKVLKQQGLWKILKPKFIYTQNALQAQMLVQQGLVDAGFIPVTKDKKNIASIPYVAVMLTNAFHQITGLGIEALISKNNSNLGATEIELR